MRASIDWERDGPEYITGRATRWTRTVVYVEWPDPRLPTTGAWLPAAGVRRCS